MKQDIINYLINNQEHLKELVTPYKIDLDALLSKEDRAFIPTIKAQYKRNIEILIIDEITYRLGLDYESVIMEIEDINLEEYFNV